MIRHLYPWEIEDVTPIAEQFHAEAALGGGFNAEVLIQHLRGWSAAGSLYLCGQYHDGQLVGALVGIISQHTMCDVLIAQELFWYVMPEHRASHDALRMVKDFEVWAKERRAFAGVMATFHGTDPHCRLPKVFHRMGYVPIETHHFKHF